MRKKKKKRQTKDIEEKANDGNNYDDEGKVKTNKTKQNQQ